MPPAIRLDILTHTQTGFWGQHLSGFALHERTLEKALGLRVVITTYAGADGLHAAARSATGDALMVLTDWSWTSAELSRVLGEIKAARPSRPLIYFDAFDQSSTPYLGILPVVDLYVKAKMLADPSGYTREYAGGYVVPDMLHRTLGWDLGGWSFGSVADPARLGKLCRGWSFGASRFVRRLASLHAVWMPRWSRRPLDLHARISPPKSGKLEWYERYRQLAREAVAPLRGRVRVTPDDRVRPLKYHLEMRRSKLVFSPFGWGELCQRDFEALAAGCLLIKPSMEHLAIRPDVFSPSETYVPIAWDLSDLGDAVDRCLRDPEGSARIAAAGWARLLGYFVDERFVKDVAAVLARVGLGPG